MREEWIIALVMVGIVALMTVLTKNNRKWTAPILLLAALAGSLVAGMGVRFREIVEGPFGFLDSMLTVLCAMIFVRMFADNGGMQKIFTAFSKVRNSYAQSFLILFFLALPGMLTGSAAASVLINAPFVAKYLEARKVPGKKIVGFIVAGAFLGMMLPPNCIPAMIAANGAGSVLPTPYVGFFMPLVLLSVPAFIVYALIVANTIFAKADAYEQPAQKENPALTAKFSVLPLIVVGCLLLADGLLGSKVYLGGQPITFAIGAVLCILLPAIKRGIKPVLKSLQQGAEDLVLPVAMIFALGAFIEVSSMSGVRGIYSLNILPYTSTAVILAGMALMLPVGFATSAALPAFIASYAIFPIGWLASPMIVAGCAGALGIAFLLPIRGGLIGHVKSSLEYDDVSYGAALLQVLVPVLLVLACGVLLVLFGGQLSALVL